MKKNQLEQNLTKQELILVTAATITGELNEVTQVTKRMTLSVMNAKTISHRAGESARGFQPITDHIEETAKDIAQFLTRISEEVTMLSRLAVTYNQGQNRLTIFKEVIKQANENAHASSLGTVIERLSDESEVYRTHLFKKLRNLSDLLDEMKKITRSSKVVSTISRVEAAGANEYRKDLEVVADDLESSTEYIQDRVVSSRNKLITVMEELSRESHR